MLINHNGLDVRDKPDRDFLTANMEAFLFQTGETEEIDTSKQGQITWKPLRHSRRAPREPRPARDARPSLPRSWRLAERHPPPSSMKRGRFCSSRAGPSVAGSPTLRIHRSIHCFWRSAVSYWSPGSVGP